MTAENALKTGIPKPGQESDLLAARPVETLSFNGDFAGKDDGWPDAAAIGEAAADGDDPLLSCLLFLVAYHGQSKSTSVLLSALPRPEGRISLDLFMRAAGRAGLSVRVVRRPLGRIHSWTLPAVLTMKDGGAVVLLGTTAPGRFQITAGDAGDGTTELTGDELEKAYSGFAILVKPEVDLGRERTGANLDRPQAWFWGTLARNGWTYLQVGLASVVINLFALANPLFTMNVYDRVLPNNAVQSGIALAIGAGLALFFDFLLRNLRGWFIDFVGRRADVMLACRIFDQVLDLKASHRPASSGAFASMLREFETVRDFFTSATLAAFIDLPFSLLFLAVIIALSPLIGLVLGSAMFLVVFWGAFVQFPIARSVRHLMTHGEHKHGVLVESLFGFETIKMVGAEGRMRAKWETVVGQSAAIGQRMRLFNNLGVNFVQFIQQASVIGIVVMGMFLVADGGVTSGGLVAAVILSGRALGPMAQVSQLMMRFHQTWSSLKSLDAVMQGPVERPADATFLHRPDLQGRIEFKEVTFRYPGNDYDVLNDISFTINPGERVGIAGRVGSGKSTIAKLLGGLYTPTTGAVLLDGTDLRHIEPSDARANIGFVPQDVFLFKGTIKENIAISVPRASDDEIARISEELGLHDFVARHPLGYDLQVGERGGGLSGGQRQSVALARTLLKHPTILVLDEPTNSMDTATEKRVVDVLTRMAEGRTIILVTHRTSVLKLVNRLIVLDKGRIVADGPKDSVLGNLAKGDVKAGR
jgi:ATP-binding cassette subfamily C protein LapB